MFRMTLLTLVGASVLAVSASVAFADRAPDSAERSSIESSLREQGFTSWGEIELDDGRWEVDDARGNDGVKYDLELDVQTLRILERERDD